jgi:hypothetical protein
VYETLVSTLRAGAGESELAELADARARELGVDAPILEVRLESAPDVEWRPIFPTSGSGVADGAVTHLVPQAWGGDGSLLAAFGDTYLIGKDASTPVAHAPIGTR